MSQNPIRSVKQDEESSTSAEAQAHISRRNVLISGAAIAATLALSNAAFAFQPETTKPKSGFKGDTVNTLTVKDGNSIYYKDWGTGQPIVFSHGWPLTADAWDAQMLFFGQHGYRVIAHDRRGHGRSSQPWNGNDMDTYADDLAELFEKLDLKDAILIGHSTGGGEVARFIGRHGTKRVAKAVLISAVTPFMLQTPDHPGAPMSVFDDLRNGLVSNRTEFIRNLSIAFYGYNKPDAKISEGIRESFWLQSMMGGLKCEYDSIKAFSETDFRGDLAKFTIPTLVLQGDVDEIVPLQISGPLTAKLVKNSTLKIYPGQPHGLCTTFADQVNVDILAFIKL